MNSEEFNDAEARFIAEEIILKRLGIKPSNPNANITYSENLTKVIKDIESHEETWSYTPKSSAHSFGRKQADEQIRFWSVPSMSAKVLAYLVSLTGAKNILEIGTSVGYSTLHLANAAKHNNGKVNTIELLNKKIELANKNFQDADCEEIIKLICAEASKVLDNWDGGKIDFVFLDADKENYGKYLDKLIPLMKSGGIIIADNINDYGHMMEDYLQKVSGTHFPKSRSDSRLKSTYVAQLDNGVMITKIL